MDTSVPVVVLHRAGTGSLAISRTLGRLGIRTYLISRRETSPVTASRYWTQRFWWDFSAAPDKTLEFLLEVRSRIGARPILLTTADWLAIFIEKNASVLREHFVFPRPSTPVVRMLSDKWQMFLLARRHGIPTPLTAYPQCRSDVIDFLESTQLPIVVKPADGFLPERTPKGIAYSKYDLLQRYDRAAADGAANLILQEYIPGSAENVWMCNAYFGAESACRAIFTGRKLRQTSPTGIASLAVCAANDTVEEQTRIFMQSVAYEGAVGIGYRYDARDGLYKVLDVNARVSGIFRLFRATNDLDIVRICYLDLTGQDVPASTPAPGRKWMLEEDVLSALKAGLERRLTFRQWLSSLRGVKETAWFAHDDPIPIFVWLWCTFCAVVLSRVRRRLLPKLRFAMRLTKT